MIVYNVTSAIDEDIEQDWLKWMREHHMPEVMATRQFVDCRLYKVLARQEPGTVTYSAQYLALNMEDVDSYVEKFAPGLRSHVSDRYGDKVVSFRTLLEEIS